MKTSKAQEFYDERRKATNWPSDEMCDPPTSDEEAVDILFNYLLGDDWYVGMPESREQCNTAAIVDILKNYVDNHISSWIIEMFFAISMVLSVIVGIIIGHMI